MLPPPFTTMRYISPEKDIETLKALAPFFGFDIIGQNNEASSMILEWSCKNLRGNSLVSILVSYVLPLICFVPILVMTILNPCLNYTGSLFIVILSLCCLGFLTALLHLWIYNCYSVFCNERMVRVHNNHTVVMFSFLSATLGYYNLYASDPNFLYVIAITCTSFITIIEYFICMFQRRHIYTCITESCTDVPMEKILCFKRGRNFLNFLGLLFIFSWTGMMISAALLQHNLWEYGEGQRPVDSCSALL